jgi:hypothetical protein
MSTSLEAALRRLHDVSDAGSDNDVIGALSDVEQAWQTVSASDYAVALGVVTHKVRRVHSSCGFSRLTLFSGLILLDTAGRRLPCLAW